MNRQPSAIAYLLAALWLFIPAVQYIGAYDRARAFTVRSAAVGPIGVADLTSWYVILLGATAVYLLSKHILGRRKNEQVNGK